jgi:copper transport protein
LYDAAGTEVAADARSVDRVVTVTPADELGRGTFVLTYRVISTDGHPVAGSLTFSVGAPSAEVVAPDEVSSATSRALVLVQGALQGLTYVALLLACGLVAFLVLLLPALPAVDLVRAQLSRVARYSAMGAAAGGVLLVPVSAAYQQGLGATGIISGTAWSHWLSADGLAAALVVAGLACAITFPGRRGRLPDASVRMLSIGGSIMALGSLPLVGHTRSYGPLWLVVPADLLHVVAAAVWFGGLVGLVVALPALAKRTSLAVQTLARFSTLAGGLVAAVGAAGLLLGWRTLGSWSALVGTTYGLLLLGKVAVVGLVVAVAAWNRYRLLPAISDPGYQDRVLAAVRLRAAVRLEAVGLIVVLLATGFLVSQVPREQPDADRQSETVTAVSDDVRVVAHLEPGRVGSNTLTVQVQSLAGEPVEPFATPRVSVSSDSVDLGSSPVRNVDSGTYEARVVLPEPGSWTVQVSVRTSEFDNPVLTLETEVASPGR